MLLAIAKSLLGKGTDAAGQEEEGQLVEETALPLEERSDEALMLLYRDGEVRAFEILLSRHERPVFHYILRSCGRQEVAEELLQEVFIRVVRSASKYKQTAKFTTWLYTIARNICIDRARKARKRQELSLDQSVGGGDGGDDGGRSFTDLLVDEEAHAGDSRYEREIFRRRLKEALDALPEEQREVFLLKEVSGLKFREIAEVVDAPVPTVKSRMRYALQALRGHLAEYREHSFDEEERQEVIKP